MPAMTAVDVRRLLQEYEEGIHLKMEVPLPALRILHETQSLEESWAAVPDWLREKIREMAVLARTGELVFIDQRDLEECLNRIGPVLAALQERGLLPGEETGGLKDAFDE